MAELDRAMVEAVALISIKGTSFENVDEIIESFINSLEYWNAHKHPYTWKKLPQEQPSIILGGYGSSWEPKTLVI